MGRDLNSLETRERGRYHERRGQAVWLRGIVGSLLEGKRNPAEVRILEANLFGAPMGDMGTGVIARK